ncbi:MAG: hypothetical protein IPO37_17665 [Saprospiraceae bacterium]|nr:hypothetical protein [Saprospiraceae bacterium]
MGAPQDTPKPIIPNPTIEELYRGKINCQYSSKGQTSSVSQYFISPINRNNAISKKPTQGHKKNSQTGPIQQNTDWFSISFIYTDVQSLILPSVKLIQILQ